MTLAPLQAAGNDDCVELQSVTVETGPAIDIGTVDFLVQPFLGQCLSPGLVGELLTDFSDYFIEQGYVTTRPYLLEQDIADGEIEVEILPGIVEAVIDAQSGESNLRIASAFAFNDQILNLRELESSLEILERPRSVQASFEIRPGSVQGGSVVVIDSEQRSALQIELGANARTDVDPQLSFAAILDNPLNLNDILEFRYNSGDIYQAYQSDRSREWQYSAPIGSYLVTYVYSDLAYRQRLQGNTGSFLSEGESVSHRLQIDKRIARAQSWWLGVGAALELEDSSNDFEGEELEVSSYKTSKLELEVRHDWFAPGVIYIRVTATSRAWIPLAPATMTFLPRKTRKRTKQPCSSRSTCWKRRQVLIYHNGTGWSEPASLAVQRRYPLRRRQTVSRQ